MTTAPRDGRFIGLTDKHSYFHVGRWVPTWWGGKWVDRRGKRVKAPISWCGIRFDKVRPDL